MNSSTQYQPAAIAQMLRTHITQEIAYDRSDLVLTNDFKLIEQGIIDSMGILRVFNFIEETFDIGMLPEDLMLENFETIDAIAALIAGKLGAA